MLFESVIYTLMISACFADFDEGYIYCKNPPPKLVHGSIKRDRVSYYNGKGYIGNMEYACLSGFRLIGNNTVTCQGGSWSKMPECLAKEHCPPIQNYPLHTQIQSSNITYFQNDPQQIVSGSMIVLRCDDHYQVDVTSGGSLIVQCLNNGTWSSMAHCRYMEAMCDYSLLNLPPRSRIIRMNFKFSEANRQLHLVGSNLEYSCEEGSRLHDGKTSLIVECLSSGSWSPLPVCEFVYATEKHTRCPYPAYMKNAFITLYNVTIWEDQTYTGQIVYECNYGFETIDGDDQITSECLNGTWTNIAECQEIPTCPKGDLLEIESQAENSYVHNVSLKYIRDPYAFVYNSYVLRSCLPNFEHDPSSPPLKIQCQRTTNTWTGVPVCRNKMLTTITGTLKTTTEIDKLFVDEETSTSDIITDKLETTTDFDEYSIDLFENDEKIVCHSNDIPLISNSTIVLSESNKTYVPGTQLLVKCRSGYVTSSNRSNFITCSNNGIWLMDDDLSECQSIKPDEHVLIDISTILPNSTDEYNDTTNFDEYLPALNSTESMIITSNDTTNTTRSRQIRQKISFCKSLPHIEHAYLLTKDPTPEYVDGEIVYNGSLLFVCRYGYVNDKLIDEPFQLICRNGEFSPKISCIEKPRCSLPPPIDSTRSSIVDSSINVFDTSTNEAIPGSFVVLNCFDRATSENSIFNMTCLDNGQWSTPPTICATPFRRRCQSSISIPNARTQIFAKLTADGYYDDGSRATYRCLDNFIHDRQSGPLHIQCKNGRWGPRPRCIPNGCLEPMPDTIENGWKSGESYFVFIDTKYYLLTRYSCHENTLMIGTSTRTIDIECHNNQWKYESLPECKLNE